MKREEMSGRIVYEDDIAIAFLEQKPAASGHIVIIPKKEVKALDELGEDDLEHLFYLASYAATTLFETLGAHGTNIITHEGEEFYIDVIARNQDDGLNFQWKPKQIPTEEMESVKGEISGKIIIGAEEPPKNPPRMEEKEEEKQVDTEEEDYMLKKLQRIP